MLQDEDTVVVPEVEDQEIPFPENSATLPFASKSHRNNNNGGHSIHSTGSVDNFSTDNSMESRSQKSRSEKPEIPQHQPEPEVVEPSPGDFSQLIMGSWLKIKANFYNCYQDLSKLIVIRHIW